MIQFQHCFLRGASGARRPREVSGPCRYPHEERAATIWAGTRICPHVPVRLHRRACPDDTLIYIFSVNAPQVTVNPCTWP